MGRFSEALDGFGLAVRLDPQDFVAHRFALICLFRLGRKSDVRSKADEIARLFPDPHFLISHFALVLRESNLEDLAEIFFRKAIDLDPRRTDAWIAIGNIAFDRRNTVEALRCYEAVLKFKPGSLEALANTGKVYTILKDYDKAIPYLEKALSIRPGYATALSTLGGVMIEKGQFDLAEQYLQGALESPSSKETQTTIHGNLGILHYKRREWDRARQRFQKVLELDPGDSQAKAVLERLESRREAAGDR
jgi:tetratricopeptide (TPR) repeat protein